MKQWHYHTQGYDLLIVEKSGKYRLFINTAPYEYYKTPQLAADAVYEQQTTHHGWDSSSLPVDCPDSLKEWECLGGSR